MSLDNLATIKDMKRFSTKERHDFMNILQIIYGYIQLDRKEDAVAYINKATNMSQSISQLYKISVFSVSLAFKMILMKLSHKGINLDVEVETSYDGVYRKIKDEEVVINRINEVLGDFLKHDLSTIDDEEIYTSIKIIENENNIEIICMNENKDKSSVLREFEHVIGRYEEIENIEDELVIRFQYGEVENIQIKDSIYSKIYSNNI